MDRKLSIGIILPSRGTIFAEVEDAIEQQREAFDIHVYRSHDLPIPDCFNYLIGEALEGNHDFIWIIEEDTVPPPGQPYGMLKKLAETKADAVAIDYPCYETSTICYYPNSDKIAFTGLGCFLTTPEVLRKVGKLRTDVFWSEVEKKYRTFNERDIVYGYQDQYMGFRMNELGLRIVQAEGVCRHLRLRERGADTTNKGLHHIVEEKPIKDKLNLFDLKAYVKE